MPSVLTAKTVVEHRLWGCVQVWITDTDFTYLFVFFIIMAIERKTWRNVFLGLEKFECFFKFSVA